MLALRRCSSRQAHGVPAAAKLPERASLNASAAVQLLCTRRPSFTFPSQALTLNTSYLTRQVERELPMNIHLTTGPIVSLIAGILILVIPRLLNYIVAIYLIIIGILGLGMLGGI